MADSFLPSAALECCHPKIFAAILVHCDWPTLMDLSRLNQASRLAVQGFVKSQLCAKLRPYLGVEADLDCDSLFEMLHNLGAGIFGKTVRDLYGVNSAYEQAKLSRATQHQSDRLGLGDGEDALQYLNVVVPLGGVISCVEWFSSRGFGSWGKWPPRREFSKTVANYVFGEREVPHTHQVGAVHLLRNFFCFDDNRSIVSRFSKARIAASYRSCWLDCLLKDTIS